MDVKGCWCHCGDGKEEGTGFSFGDWVVRRERGRGVREIKL